MQLGLKVSSVLKITGKSLSVGHWDFPNWSNGSWENWVWSFWKGYFLNNLNTARSNFVNFSSHQKKNWRTFFKTLVFCSLKRTRDNQNLGGKFCSGTLYFFQGLYFQLKHKTNVSSGKHMKDKNELVK